MARRQSARSALAAVPLLPRETLYVGVDIGKARHVAGFLSPTLLQRHERFEGCPTLAFEQSREGFRAFVDRLQEYVPLEQVQVLLEHTGHYHRLLEQYLLELDITVYRIHVQKRAAGILKTDSGMRLVSRTHCTPSSRLGHRYAISCNWSAGSFLPSRPHRNYGA